MRILRIILAVCMVSMIGIIQAQDDAPIELDEPEITVYDWSVSGDVINPTFGDDRICAQASDDDGMWSFSAPQTFVEWVQNAYGDTLGFGIEQLGTFPDAAALWLVVGNGVLLEYPLNNVDRDLSYHIVPLRAGAGWVDVDGQLTEDIQDGEVFQEFLENVTQVLIQGSTNSCLLNADIYITQATAPFVPYYVYTYEDDGSGLPSGCEGFIIEQSSDINYEDDVAENIRSSLEALFAYSPDETSDFVNYLNQPLTVDSVTVEEGFATVEIGGTLMQVGTCVDGSIETQILLSVFHNPEVERAMILVNGENMKPQFDMSDMTPDDAEYSPADFRFRLYNE